MKRFITVLFSLFITLLLSAQGFPDAEKQPKMKEQHRNQRKYAKRAHRKHVKRGTVYVEPANTINQPQAICLLTFKKAGANIA